MRSTAARILYSPDDEADRFLPEGPRVLPDGSLAWVNIQKSAEITRGTIFSRSVQSSSSPVRYEQPSRPGFALPTDQAGTLLVGREKEIGLLTLSTGSWRTLATIPDDHPRTIINDAEIVPGGTAVVFGTKDLQFREPIAHLYLFTPDDCRVSTLADGQTCSNGKLFASGPLGLILFDIDTPTRSIVRYRLDQAARTATTEGVAIDLADRAGFPDGMCDCGDGTAIVAFYNPDPVPEGHAVRFDLQSGRAVEEWTTPGSPRVTCPALVQEPDGVKLILTTATEGMPAEMRAKCPNAGSLFIAETALDRLPSIELVRLSP